MQRSRIVLANRPRIMRELLGRAILRSPRLRIVAEVTDLTKLPSAVEQTEADWVIVTLPPGGRIPTMVTSLLAGQQSVCILAVSADGSRATVRAPSGVEHALQHASLAKVLATIRSELRPAVCRRDPEPDESEV
jgi:hypothetical protein